MILISLYNLCLRYLFHLLDSRNMHHLLENYSVASLVLWHDQSSIIDAQQNDQPELQITLQEVIGMIDSTASEETRGDDVRSEETRGDDARSEETRGDNVRPEETGGDNVRPEETLTDEVQQWFDWVV